MDKFIKLHESTIEHLLKVNSIIHVWDSQYKDEDCRTVQYWDGFGNQSIIVDETIDQIHAKIIDSSKNNKTL